MIPLIHPTTIIITCLSQLGIKPNCGFDTSTQIINCQMFQTQYKYPGLIVQLAREVDHVFFCLTGKLNTFFVLTHHGIVFSDIWKWVVFKSLKLLQLLSKKYIITWYLVGWKWFLISISMSNNLWPVVGDFNPAHELVFPYQSEIQYYCLLQRVVFRYQQG